MYRVRPPWRPIACFLVVAFLGIGSGVKSSGQELLTAAGKPAEGPLDVFLNEPSCDMQVVFEGEGRFPTPAATAEATE